MRSVREYDLVCVGSGAGGLTAAIVAAEHGLRPLVVEKDARLGGVTAWSAGQVWVGANHLAAEAGVEDSIEDACAYLDYLSSGLGDPARARDFLALADAAILFLRNRVNIDLRLVRGFPDYYFGKTPAAKPEGRYIEAAPFPLARLAELRERFVDPTIGGHGLASSADLVASGGDLARLGAMIAEHLGRDERCGGAALAGALLAAAAEREVELWTETRAVRLLTEDGAVTGVEVVHEGERTTIRASGVLLASGGYDWNAELMRAFEHVGETASMAPATVEGDHLAMACELGARVSSARPEATPLMAGLHLPGHTVEGRPVYQALGAARPGAIFVNRAGRRFADESFYPAVSAAMARYDGADPSTPNRPAWLIFDAEHRRRYPLGTLPPGDALPDGLAVSAGDLATLAATIGVDPAGLVATVERFNAMCELGVDEDFGRGEVPWSRVSFGDPNMSPNPLLGPLATPPFHAIKLAQVGMGIPSAGLEIDTSARVLSVRGEPIPGLYAAGNAAARTDIPGYQSGIANARGLAFGYSAALDLAAALSVERRLTWPHMN